MMPLRSFVLAGHLAAAVALSAPAGAQGAPAPLPPTSPPPPAPAVTPAPPVPPANAVALCNDGSFIVPPAAASGCAARGGLKLTLPGPRGAPPAPAAQPAAVRAEPMPRDDAPPAGATMRCKDGTWLSGTPAASRCVSNGGLATILPRTPSGPPTRPPTP